MFRAAVLAALCSVVLAVPLAGAVSAEAVAYPAMSWLPASSANYDVGRRGNAISYIVIHDTESSYSSALGVFQDPRAKRSAHYVVSGTGAVTRMVAESNTAWHAGNYTYNLRSIGIEHELYRGTNPFYTEAEYQASAQLVCAIASRYGVQLDRQHVIGHVEVPFATHTDPGPTWDWPHYMWLLSLCADPRGQVSSYHASWAGQSAPAPIPLGSAGDVVVSLRNSGSVAWVKGSATEARLGIPGDDLTLAGAGLATSWLLPTRPAAQSEAAVQPGQVATFRFSIRGASPGGFRVNVRPVVDGIAWLEDQGIYVDVLIR